MVVDLILLGRVLTTPHLPPPPLQLLQLVKKLILISDQETFKRAFPRFDADKGMDWEDEGHRLQVLKALSAFLPNVSANI